MTERPAKLTEVEIDAELTKLDGWIFRAEQDALYKKFQFTDFAEAWGFMNRVAIVAEKMDHHPDWSNSYNNVAINLATHDRGGVTKLDIELARAINLAEKG